MTKSSLSSRVIYGKNPRKRPYNFRGVPGLFYNEYDGMVRKVSQSSQSLGNW